MYDIQASNVFKAWMAKLNKPAAAVVAARIDKVRRGLFGDAKPVGGGVSELRIHVGPGYRVYYKQTGTTIMFLLNGGSKATQQKDIAKAQEIAMLIE